MIFRYENKQRLFLQSMLSATDRHTNPMPQHPSKHQAAESTLLQLRTAPNALHICRHILQHSHSLAARFQAATAVREAAVRQWPALSIEYRRALRQFLLQLALRCWQGPWLPILSPSPHHTASAATPTLSPAPLPAPLRPLSNVDGLTNSGARHSSRYAACTHPYAKGINTHHVPRAGSPCSIWPCACCPPAASAGGPCTRMCS